MFKSTILLYFIAWLSVITGRPPWIHHGRLEVSDAYKMLQELLPGGLPNTMCNVTYRGHFVVPGSKLNHTLIAYQPEVTWTAYNDTYYTLYLAGIWLVRPKYLKWGKYYTTPYMARAEILEWDHWVVFNIPGCNVGKGEVVARYMPPRVGLDEELYAFMIFEQPGKLNEDDVLFRDRLADPVPLTVMNFTKQYNLSTPIAANYFVKLQ